jgi:hypothetical protein
MPLPQITLAMVKHIFTKNTISILMTRRAMGGIKYMREN